MLGSDCSRCHLVEGSAEIMWEQDDKFINEMLSQIEMPNERLNFDLDDEYFSLTKQQPKPVFVCFLLVIWGFEKCRCIRYSYIF